MRRSFSCAGVGRPRECAAYAALRERRPSPLAARFVPSTMRPNGDGLRRRFVRDSQATVVCMRLCVSRLRWLVTSCTRLIASFLVLLMLGRSPTTLYETPHTASTRRQDLTITLSVRIPTHRLFFQTSASSWLPPPRPRLPRAAASSSWPGPSTSTPGSSAGAFDHWIRCRLEVLETALMSVWVGFKANTCHSRRRARGS